MITWSHWNYKNHSWTLIVIQNPWNTVTNSSMFAWKSCNEDKNKWHFSIDWYVATLFRGPNDEPVWSYHYDICDFSFHWCIINCFPDPIYLTKCIKLYKTKFIQIWYRSYLWYCVILLKVLQPTKSFPFGPLKSLKKLGKWDVVIQGHVLWNMHRCMKDFLNLCHPAVGWEMMGGMVRCNSHCCICNLRPGHPIDGGVE